MTRETEKPNDSTEVTELETAAGISLDQIIDSSAQKNYSKPERYFGVSTALLQYDSAHKVFFIEHPFDKGNTIPVFKSLVALVPNDAGQEILVSFDKGLLEYPVITGKIQQLSHEPCELQVDMSATSNIDLNLDQKDKLVFKAEQEIVLQCGKSSITLTKAGKILIRGTYVLSRSSGVNKIKGGSVQLN